MKSRGRGFKSEEREWMEERRKRVKGGIEKWDEGKKGEKDNH